MGGFATVDRVQGIGARAVKNDGPLDRHQEVLRWNAALEACVPAVVGGVPNAHRVRQHGQLDVGAFEVAAKVIEPGVAQGGQIELGWRPECPASTVPA